MSDSSQPQTSSTNSDDELTLGKLETVKEELEQLKLDFDELMTSTATMSTVDWMNTTLTSTAVYQPNYTYYVSNPVNTVNYTYKIDSSLWTTTTTTIPEEWKDKFPDWARVQEMIEKYPGLKVAYENFRVMYEMVKDDYDSSKKGQ